MYKRLNDRKADKMIVTLNEVLKDAKKNKYAIGLFNTVNLEMAKGVLSAAEETKSPVIIGTAEVLLQYSSLEELSYLLVPMARKASIPVVLHFDHGLTEDCIIKAMTLGFSSVMYDCSTSTFEENMRKSKEMCRIARLFGASIEAELGHVGAADADVVESDAYQGMYTDPAQAKEFAEFTNVDALAVAIGTAHGAYKSNPKLDLIRLKEIADIIDTPLVLHGGSGLSDQDFKNCVENGVCKINIFTDINNAAAKAAYESYRPGCGMTDLMGSMVKYIIKETIAKMNIFGCTGKG
ncbi:MAG: class II fructose-bisphosphate aldolase [Bacillota bacterium]|nr:class II fructose-bisphosphate aldolase [Bacillota bacterium]